MDEAMERLWLRRLLKIAEERGVASLLQYLGMCRLGQQDLEAVAEAAADADPEAPAGERWGHLEVGDLALVRHRYRYRQVGQRFFFPVWVLGFERRDGMVVCGNEWGVWRFPRAALRLLPTGDPAPRLTKK